MAYVPLIVAILDAGLYCIATLPAPAEMGASLHIARSKSSVLDTVFVCRKRLVKPDQASITECLSNDIRLLSSAGLKIREGDIRCLLAGHIARKAINRLRQSWNVSLSLKERMSIASTLISKIGREVQIQAIITDFEKKETGDTRAAAV